MTSNLPELTHFFSTYLLPELLTQKLKLTDAPYDPHTFDANDVEDNDESILCSCREGPMVACDNVQCRIEWFHFYCVGLQEIPAGDWFCNECICSNVCIFSVHVVIIVYLYIYTVKHVSSKI